jgi:flagellar motility protein MotE (MotC chaperone)
LAKDKPEVTPEKKSGIKGYLLLGVGSFIIFLFLFSFLSGAFQQKRIVQPNAPSENITNGIKNQDSTLTQSIDTSGTLVNSFPDSNSLSTTDSTAVSASSDKEKEEIKKEREKLEGEKKELELLKVEVQTLLDKKKKFEDEGIIALAKLYDGMKADKAASLLNNLEEQTAVAVINKMKIQNASKVMGYLAPEKAARISNAMISLK